jgi:hypothetical protein
MKATCEELPRRLAENGLRFAGEVLPDAGLNKPLTGVGPHRGFFSVLQLFRGFHVA